MTDHPGRITFTADADDLKPASGRRGRSLAETRDDRERQAEARRRRRMRRKRLRRSLALLVVVATPLAALFALWWRPVKVAVDDRGVWTWGNRSVASAIVQADLRLPAGDLVDVRGGVLTRGAGKPPIPVAHGRPISYGAPARDHRKLTLEPGGDRPEPTKATATLLASAGRAEWEDNWKPLYVSSNAAVVGIDRREHGAISGLPYIFERAVGKPIEAGAGGDARRPKRMALTFDDGPNGATTREIQSILEAHGARGTFFLLGDCISLHEDVVQAAAAAGHEIANHSWGHPNMARMSVAAALANIERAERIISPASGKRSRWFRPPYGSTTARLRKAILEAGYNIALWSWDTNDWQRPGTQTIYRRVINGAEPGAVVLMHDGGARSQTVAAVRRAVPELIRMGYELVTLSEMTASMPGGDAGMILTTNEGSWEARLPGEPIHVLVHGRELKNPGPVLVVGGKALLPAPAVLDALRAEWEWDRGAQIITISSLRGRFRFRLDSRRITWDDRELRMDVPPLLYHSVPLISAEALARASGARLEERLAPRSFNFVALGPAR